MHVNSVSDQQTTKTLKLVHCRKTTLWGVTCLFHSGMHTWSAEHSIPMLLQTIWCVVMNGRPHASTSDEITPHTSTAEFRQYSHDTRHHSTRTQCSLSTVVRPHHVPMCWQQDDIILHQSTVEFWQHSYSIHYNYTWIQCSLPTVVRLKCLCDVDTLSAELHCSHAFTYNMMCCVQ